MEVCALSSGSSGNCFYIENNKSAVLIDAGISSKQIVDKISSIGKNPERVKAIFLTHEHSDHIKGVEVFSKKFNVPVFATKGTLEESHFSLDKNLITPIRNNQGVNICEMDIEPFSKSHKSSDPVSYSISNGKKISIITDLGYACKNVIKNISDSECLFIESNYDDGMLMDGFYPPFLKQWIRSNEGHLSNSQSALSVLEHSSPQLKNLILCHISQNNNLPNIALKTFKILKERKDLSPKIFVSERESHTPLLKI